MRELPPLIVSKDVTDNVQVVAHFLKLVKNKEVDNVDLYFKGLTPPDFCNYRTSRRVNPLSQEECQSLIFDEISKTISQPNYYQITSFIDVLAAQFKEFNRNFLINANFLSDCRLDTSIRTLIIESYIKMTKHFTKGAFTELIQTQEKTRNTINLNQYNADEDISKGIQELSNIKPNLISFDKFNYSLIFFHEGTGQNFSIISNLPGILNKNNDNDNKDNENNDDDYYLERAEYRKLKELYNFQTTRDMPKRDLPDYKCFDQLSFIKELKEILGLKLPTTIQEKNKLNAENFNDFINKFEETKNINEDLQKRNQDIYKRRNEQFDFSKISINNELLTNIYNSIKSNNKNIKIITEIYDSINKLNLEIKKINERMKIMNKDKKEDDNNIKKEDFTLKDKKEDNNIKKEDFTLKDKKEDDNIKKEDFTLYVEYEGFIKLSLEEIVGKYVFTADNFIKMLLILLRIRANIPVIMMGETGCGKTSLIRMLSRLLNDGSDEKMKVLNIHAGTTDNDIIKFIEEKILKEAVKIQKEDKEEEKRRQQNNYIFKARKIWVFLDEINTCKSMGLISELMCKHSYQGKRLPSNIVFIAACNPYRCYEKGKRVTAGLDVNQAHKQKKNLNERDLERLRKNANNNLVYTVNPLPYSLLNYVFDFGNLEKNDEYKYIESIIEKPIKNIGKDKLNEGQIKKIH